MPRSPYKPDQLAQARHLLTHTGNFADLPKEDLEDLIRTAWALLHSDRSARLAPDMILRHPTPGHSGDAA